VNAHQIVEAVLFAADAPLTADEIARADEHLDEDGVEDALQFLRAEYDDAQRSFQIVEVAEGYQILTRPEFAPYLERFDNVPRPARLSGPALETLAIIAYRQPLGRLEIEYVRGVGASGVIRTLQDRQLIDVVGRAEGLGRPLLYGTTRQFLEHFGFPSLEALPRPEELPVVLRDRVPLGPEDEEGDGEGEAQEELPLSANGAGEATATAEAVEADAEGAPGAESDTAEPVADDPDAIGEGPADDPEDSDLPAEPAGG
jgi:segregation and condensation protein B